ncbi:ribulose-phosphate 3-epimerase [candidate division WOR-3 bacterium]|nr:ribulose-phosphate 3-epimerase [candidate division WOR-3 bacterium]
MPSNKAFNIIKKCSPTLSVGITSADLLNIGSEIAKLEGTDIKVMHFDVMDGCFVPRMTVGPPFIKAVKTQLLKDVHLMIQDPEGKVWEYVDAGADMITIHIESCEDAHLVLRELRTMENKNDPDRGLIRGIALNSDTSVELLKPLLDDIEMIVVLAVNLEVKGFPFFDSIGDKFREVKDMVSTPGKEILLCIDGGVKKNNISEFARMGADILVSGSAIFDGKNPVGNIRFMLNEIKS